MLPFVKTPIFAPKAPPRSVIVTEWDAFRALDLARIKDALSEPMSTFAIFIRHLTCVKWRSAISSFAVVTPTYLPDLARCELLAESLDRVAPQVPHCPIVDRHDRAAFSHLERGQHRLVESEALIGKWMWRIPERKGFWARSEGAAGA